jgi:methionine-gamma-lyase
MKKRPAGRTLSPEETTLATRSIHGRKLHAFRGPVAEALVQTSTYRFSDSHDAIRYAQGDPEVYVYTRYHNPTVGEAQDRLALLHGTEKALLLSSGMAAISSAVLSVVKQGDEIISTPALYGGTYRLFRDILPRHGITVRYVRADDLGRIPLIASRKTALVYSETPTNPTLGIVDLVALNRAAREASRKTKRRILTLVDNTFATAANQQPISLGIDLVVESATKYLGGHTDMIAGMVAGPAALVDAVHTQMKYYGGCADPFVAWLLIRSLKTFDLRMKQHNANAMNLARYLASHPKVRRVLYPGLSAHPGHEVARGQMVDRGGNGFGGMVTIEVGGGVRHAVRVCDALQVAINAMSLGGVETLVSIPVYSSHINMSTRELASHGVTPGMVRISVGIEGIEDLRRDFDRALRLP